MYDIIIIGAGIAGLTSAIYAKRSNKKVLVLEGKSYGGQIINSMHIENYPGYLDISGYDLMTNIYNQAIKLGVEIINEEVLEIKDHDIITEDNTYNTKTIIIATGLISKKLEIDNIDKYIGNGISICATCDGNFYRDKVVAVVGGGNTALEDALYLSNICNKVYLINRKDKFKGEEYLVDKINSKDNIIKIMNKEVISIKGNDFLEEIKLNDNSKLKIDGLFMAIGKISNGMIYNGIVDTTSNGYIISNEECKTSKDYIFAAGDCRNKKLRQLITAASDGAIAATSAIKYIGGNHDRF